MSSNKKEVSKKTNIIAGVCLALFMLWLIPSAPPTAIELAQDRAVAKAQAKVEAARDLKINIYVDLWGRLEKMADDPASFEIVKDNTFCMDHCVVEITFRAKNTLGFPVLHRATGLYTKAGQFMELAELYVL